MNEQLPPFDLIIEPLSDGMVLVGASITSLPDFKRALGAPQDGFAMGLLCGGCAKELLSVILERAVPDLFVARGYANGDLLALDTTEERRAVLDMLGMHIH
jgi:hypothetical protein